MNRTPLHSEHLRLGAVMIEFHGWEMPVRYGSIPDEHRRVRESAGLFDLCHMGRIELRGDEHGDWLDRVITNDFRAIAHGRARYTLILNEDGTVLDDAIVYRLPDLTLLVVNASNRDAVLEWLDRHREDRAAERIDRSDDWAMVAVQGPEAQRITAEVALAPTTPWDELKYYSITEARVFGDRAFVARTGYTGENGYELYVDAKHAERLWQALLDAGGERIAPIGLGARDTLRLEAGMPLCGNDIDGTTTPLEAGLDFAVKFDKAAEFIGREALLEQKRAGVPRRLAGFRVDGRRAARAGMSIVHRDGEVGRVTSGAPSPTLGYPIALGYLNADVPEDAELSVDIRGRNARLERHPVPFFSRVRKAKTKA